MRWGLLPFFHKGSLKAWKAATFNAKAETARTLVSFREPFKRRRCLIAADGWVE
jgi:putative SOS response-associated peptidase YedK